MRFRGPLPRAQTGPKIAVQTNPVPRGPQHAGPLGGQADRERRDERLPRELEPAVAGRLARAEGRQEGFRRESVARGCQVAGQEAEWCAAGGSGGSVVVGDGCRFVVFGCVAIKGRGC